MWKALPPDSQQIRLMKHARDKHDLCPLVIHDNYLINMASCDEGLRSKSVAAFRGEIERARAIGAEYLVTHPGSCKGHTVEKAIYTFCRSLGEATSALRPAG